MTITTRIIERNKITLSFDEAESFQRSFVYKGERPLEIKVNDNNNTVDILWVDTQKIPRVIIDNESYESMRALSNKLAARYGFEGEEKQKMALEEWKQQLEQKEK